MAQVIKATFQLRRGLLEAWERNNPILAKGEPGFVLDKNALKIGDGVTPWKELDYIGLSQEDLAKAIEDYFEENPDSCIGADGRGIVSITRTSGDGTPGTKDTYTIYYTDNTTSTFDVTNGHAGDDYVLTDADKAEIAEMAADLVEVPDSGGKVDFVVQDTPPEDTSVLWINTSYEGEEQPGSSADIQEAVNNALAQAKKDGLFDGEKGDPGDDYVLTDADKTEIAEMAAGMVEVPDSGGNVYLTGAKVGETILVNSVDENGKPTEWKSADMVVQNIEDATIFSEKAVMTGFYFYLSAPLPNGYYYYDAAKYGPKLLYMVVINAEGTAVDKQLNLGRPNLFHISSNESEIVITEVDATENAVEYVYDIANKTYESYVVRYCSRKIDELLEGRILSPESATVGQVVVVKSVDENGKPIEWECVNAPSDGSAEINPSWNQNDSEHPDYIDGRTHYCEFTDTVLVDEEITVTDQYYEDTQFIYRHNKDFDFSKEGFTYEVSMFGETVTDVIHNPKARTLSATFSNGVRVIFEENSVWSKYPDGLTRPFTTGFKIVERLIVYHTLDEQYIPDTIARVTDIPSDDHINSLINAALGVIENGTY